VTNFGSGRGTGKWRDILKRLLSVMVFAVAPFAIGAAGVLVAASVFGYSVRARLPDVMQLALLPRNARDLRIL